MQTMAPVNFPQTRLTKLSHSPDSCSEEQSVADRSPSRLSSLNSDEFVDIPLEDTFEKATVPQNKFKDRPIPLADSYTLKRGIYGILKFEIPVPLESDFKEPDFNIKSDIFEKCDFTVLEVLKQIHDTNSKPLALGKSYYLFHQQKGNQHARKLSITEAIKQLNNKKSIRVSIGRVKYHAFQTVSIAAEKQTTFELRTINSLKHWWDLAGYKYQF